MAAVPNPAAAVVLVPGLLPLVRHRWGLPWVLGAVFSAGLILLDRVESEVPRLIASVWVSAALGIGVGGVEVVRRFQGRKSAPGARVDPAAEV